MNVKVNFFATTKFAENLLLKFKNKEVLQNVNCCLYLLLYYGLTSDSRAL